MAVVSLILSKFQNIFAIFVGSDISILHKKGGQSCRSELETLTPGITPRVGVSYSGFNSHERKRVHRMAIILAITNSKGGVGKTTTTASVGSILATKGYKVLVIDLDAQANLTSSLIKGEVSASIYDAMKKSTALPIYRVNEKTELDLVPASLELAQADFEMASKIARERILANLLEDYKDKYDYIIMDCPPSLGLMTFNAITASDYVIIPLVAEILPFNGLKMISDFIGQLKKYLNPKIEILGILITRWESTNLSKGIEERLRNNLGEKIFTTKIRKNVTIAQAPLEATNIVEYDPKSNGAIDYQAFTDEILERMK